MAVTVTLPDGKALELQDGATGADAAAAIGPGLARAALAIEIGVSDSSPADGASESDGASGPSPAHPADRSKIGQHDLARELWDLSRPLPDGARIGILTDRGGEQALALIRHDAAHVLAAAVMELWPGVRISIGPAIENGFYYDFEFPEGCRSPRRTSPRSKSACAPT